MLAVKAKYENGTVRWERKPPVESLHDLIVVFADVPASEPTGRGTVSSANRDESAESDDKQIWAGFSLANLEAAYGDDETEYSDVMLKTPNPEFAP